jgi:hypothetical protein
VPCASSCGCRFTQTTMQADVRLSTMTMNVQEMLLDELVQGAADKTLRSGRTLLSYTDVGEVLCYSA